MMPHSDQPASSCIGVDVGGTFTDVVLSQAGRVHRAKAPTTPRALGDGVLAACELVAAEAGTTLVDLLPRITRFGLGTTAVTNTIASRTGLKVGLVTTVGFEDIVPIARAKRTHRDGWLEPPFQLVDRECVIGIAERVDRSGTVLREVNVDDVLAAAKQLIEGNGVEALTVSMLWSFVNDANEKAAVAALRETYPDLPVMSAAELLPVIREYERTQFALLNAYTAGALTGVVELSQTLQSLGLRRPPLLVHSGAGSISVAQGRRVPALLAESGPAAGIVAALEICQVTGITEAVTGDVGGTSFDVSFISGGESGRRSNGELMGVWSAMPMVDIDSVGAGGGSLAWIDAVGMLQVGPRSAGAVPGPACYGRGGTDATVTDALVVLGYVDPDNFLGGHMPLDRPAAVAACAAVGDRLSLDAVDAAWGIWEVAQAGMSGALRREFAQRGVDPREFTMLVMGGCGALFGAELAKTLGIRRILVPELASVLSAWGAAASDIRRERSRSVGVMLPTEESTLQAVIADLERDVRSDLAADGVADDEIRIQVVGEMRFMRQTFELPITWDGHFDAAGQEAQRQRFLREYIGRYGTGATVTGAPIELVTLRAVGHGGTARARLGALDSAAPSAPPSPHRLRSVHIDRSATPQEVPVYRRIDLGPGARVVGPALIDAVDTTCWVPPAATVEVDAFGNLNVHVEPHSDLESAQ